jgi:FixJ family two-component response regulator
VRASEAQLAAAGRREEIERRYALLTPREREVARRVARGMPNKVIARELAISDRTVQVHRTHVLEKMGVHSAAELANLLPGEPPG